ncbi:MAG: hypothetical protein ACHQLQ_05480 [Candidatus Acidiferrales bacterium]
MFEAGQDEKQDSSTKMWIGIFVIVAVAGLGALYYAMTKGTAKAPAENTAPAAEAPAGPTNADPLRDLKVQRATMEKDHAGTTAVWSVTIENRSNKYAYSEITYETTYMDAANKPLLVNKGRLPASIGPGEQATPEIRDALYPAGTVLYKFKITDAKSTAQ